jgi:hypothetical protein
VGDAARRCVELMESDSPPFIANVCGTVRTIAELARDVEWTVQSGASLEWDASKPDGFPRKVMDGVHPISSLAASLSKTYEWFVSEMLARWDLGN